MNEDLAAVVIYALLGFVLWVVPLVLCYREGARIQAATLCVVVGALLGWVGWVAVKLIVSGRVKEERRSQASAEAALRHRMRQARGELLE